jgi:hypothetical protein
MLDSGMSLLNVKEAVTLQESKKHQHLDDPVSQEFRLRRFPFAHLKKNGQMFYYKKFAINKICTIFVVL